MSEHPRHTSWLEEQASYIRRQRRLVVSSWRAAANEREVQQIRDDACPRCTATHPGEC